MPDGNRLALHQAVANLDVWLETMRQPGGYGGPVAHWWQNRYRYTGPGLDWRYEGVLIGYSTLLRKTGSPRWRERMNQAATDLLEGQQDDGSYRASRFEINPGTLGTPHEAAATLGLFTALPCLKDKERALKAASRNLDNLIAKLWDGRSFNDLPGIPGRVPNKLATLAQALMLFAQVSGDESYLPYAEAALKSVLHYQVRKGRFTGAVHQYAPDAGKGDGRFFPYYNARCIVPLVFAAKLFDEPRYLEAAGQILGFVGRSMNEDGSWPQVIYENGARADWPRWIAGVADILLAYRALNEPIPEVALERLLAYQLLSGGFPTAQGFSSQIHQRPSPGRPDYRDVTPIVGWNDKVLRVLSELLEVEKPIPEAAVHEAEMPVTFWKHQAVFRETPCSLAIVTGDGEIVYQWFKDQPWAQVWQGGVDIR